MSDKIDQLLKLEEENNQLLKALIKLQLQKSDVKDFTMNVLANLISNRM